MCHGGGLNRENVEDFIAELKQSASKDDKKRLTMLRLFICDLHAKVDALRDAKRTMIRDTSSKKRVEVDLPDEAVAIFDRNKSEDI